MFEIFRSDQKIQISITKNIINSTLNEIKIQFQINH